MKKTIRRKEGMGKRWNRRERWREGRTIEKGRD